MTVVVGSDGSDNSVVKLFYQLLISIQRLTTHDLGKSLLVKVGPRLLGVLNMSAWGSFILIALTALS